VRSNAARTALAVLLITALASCGAQPKPAAAPRHQRCTLSLDAILRVPDGPREPRPLILALHGATQSGAGLQAYSGLTRAARDVVVAYPSTPHDDGFWRVSDVPRVLRLAEQVRRCTPITRTTAVGFSNGGLLANALACHAARRVDALVLISAGYRNLGPCHPKRPLPVLAFHGTRDGIVPYRGFRRFMDSWARRDDCGAPTVAKHRFAAEIRWHGCDVTLVRGEDDTHGWPALTGANRRIVAFAATAR
jgi:polyhydroxybutyrate depolymerase